MIFSTVVRDIADERDVVNYHDMLKNMMFAIDSWTGLAAITNGQPAVPPGVPEEITITEVIHNLGQRLELQVGSSAEFR